MMCDCDYPEFFETATVKARKQHVCYECGVTIDVGDQYESASGKWNGYFETFHTCLPCEELRKRLTEESKCCVPYGEIAEHMMEYRVRWGSDGREFWKRNRRSEQKRKAAPCQ